jgi:hypothetical protein
MKAKLLLPLVAALLLSRAASAQTADTATPPPAPPVPKMVDGEKFTPRQILDAKLQNIPAFNYSAPATWKDESQIYWEFGNINMPATASISVTNPANEEAFFMFEPQQFFTIVPDGGFYREGYSSCKVTKLHPQEPPVALAAFIKRQRQDVEDLKIIGWRDLPDLPKSLQVQLATTQKGVGIRVTYKLNGKPVEEEFYSVYYYQSIPAGRVSQVNWGLGALHSFRAPAGTLDKRRNVYCAIVKSIKMQKPWFDKAYAIKKQLIATYQRNLKASYDQIAAAAALSKQITAQSDAFLANVDRSLAASRQSTYASSAATEGAEPRSANDKQDDYIRGVDTTVDPLYGTSQHSFNDQYHWTDGYGNYRNSSDINYDPNHHEVGSWQLMPLAQ